MGRPLPGVERALPDKIEGLGYELVAVEWAGSAQRPILRLRVDVPGTEPGRGVTLDQCAEVSRGLEGWLDAHPEVPERYVLEVSSPGVDRPLTRPKDWARFAGHRVVVKGESALAGRSKRLEGELLAPEGAEDRKQIEEGCGEVRLRLDGGEVVRIPQSEIVGGQLVFEW